MAILDAHVHLWSADFESYPLAPDWPVAQVQPPSFTPAEFAAHADPYGVERVLLIQHTMHGTDQRYLSAVMAAAPDRYRGVAVVDEADPELPATVAQLHVAGFRGFRVGQDAESAAEWTERPGLRRLADLATAHGMALCPLVNPAALPALGPFAAARPELTIVIDHLGRLGADGTLRAAEIAALTGLASCANVHVKVSAFYALGLKRPPHDDLRPLIEQVIAAYGVDRLMWASDAPYQVVSETYGDSLALIDTLPLGVAEREALLGGTAARLFFG